MISALLFKDMIEYKARDGTIKKMSKEEMAKRMGSQAEMPQMGPDGKLSKEEKGKATLQEVSAKEACDRTWYILMVGWEIL